MGIILIFMEMMLTLLLYNSLFNKGRMGRVILYCIVVIIFSVMFYSYSETYGIFVYLILLIAEIFAVAYIDKKDNNIVLTEMFISLVISFILQNSVVTIIYFLTGETKEYRDLHLIIYAFIMLIIMIVLNYNKKFKSLNLQKYIEDNILISNVLLNIFMFFIMLKIIYDSGNLESAIIIQINLLIFINILFNINFYKNLHKSIIKSKDMEIKNTYNPLLDEIIENIKANEHEYKNHIGIIYSMIQVAESIPELKNMTGKYIGSIEGVNIVSNVLNIESTIVKAVLYSKLVECNKWGIILDYEINADLEDSLLHDTEINIILNNLLNNAIDATKDATQKNISINIKKLERYRIEIKNNILGLDINTDNIEDFFKKGFSSKGKGRGYGLYNVKKIVKKYKGSIYTRIVEGYLVIEIYV